MRKIGMWAGALGVIGTILFMLMNRYEDKKEIKRLDDESRFWKDAYKEELNKSCALEVEKSGVKFVLRKMEEAEELNEAMVKSGLTHWQAKTLDDYIWGD